MFTVGQKVKIADERNLREVRILHSDVTLDDVFTVTRVEGIGGDIQIWVTRDSDGASLDGWFEYRFVAVEAPTDPTEPEDLINFKKKFVEDMVAAALRNGITRDKVNAFCEQEGLTQYLPVQMRSIYFTGYVEVPRTNEPQDDENNAREITEAALTAAGVNFDNLSFSW